MANEDTYTTSNSDNYAYQGSIGGNSYGTCAIGDSTVLGDFTGMIRFPSIPINQGVTVNFAQLFIYASNVGDSGTMRTQCYGVDEDNTAVLTGDPFGRPETTAVATVSDTRPAQGGYEDYVVTDHVNEILVRGGWSNGNAMAFKIKENGSDSNVWMSDPSSGAESMLLIRVSAEPDFTPNSKTINSPALLDISKYGLRVSKQNVTVLTASENNLNFNPAKKFLKIIKQGETETTSGVLKQISHGFTFTPLVFGWIKGNNYRFKLNRFLGGAADPVGGGIEGFIGATATTIEILTTPGAKVYYYAVSDRLA